MNLMLHLQIFYHHILYIFLKLIFYQQFLYQIYLTNICRLYIVNIDIKQYHYYLRQLSDVPYLLIFHLRLNIFFLVFLCFRLHLFVTPVVILVRQILLYQVIQLLHSFLVYPQIPNQYLYLYYRCQLNLRAFYFFCLLLFHLFYLCIFLLFFSLLPNILVLSFLILHFQIFQHYSFLLLILLTRIQFFHIPPQQRIVDLVVRDLRYNALIEKFVFLFFSFPFLNSLLSLLVFLIHFVYY